MGKIPTLATLAKPVTEEEIFEAMDSMGIGRWSKQIQGKVWMTRYAGDGGVVYDGFVEDIPKTETEEEEGKT